MEQRARVTGTQEGFIAMEDIDIPELVEKEPGRGTRRSQYSGFKLFQF